MAKYRITAPDGKSYDITAPDDATQDQVLAYAQQNYQQPAGPPREERIAAQRAEDMERYAPTRGMSTGQRVAAGFGKAYADTYRGAKQLNAETMRDQVGLASTALRGVGLAGLADFVDQNVGGKLSKRAERIQSEVNEARNNDAPLMDTAGGITGNVLGNVSQVLLPAGALRGTVAARTLLPTTVAGNALQGAVMGGLQPVADGESRAENVGLGAAFGGGGAVLAKGAGAAYRGARGVVDSVRLGPSTAAAGRQLMQESRSGLERILQAQPSAVPGVQRTLAEETLDPGLMALENTLRGTQSAQFAPREGTNNLARVMALRGIAGDDAAMTTAEAARREATGGLRNRAFAEGDEAAALAMQAGASPAGNVASLRGRIGELMQAQGGRSSVQRALNEVMGELDNAEPSVQGLYNVRKSINDLIEGRAGSDKGYAQAATAELIQARTLLDEEIANLAPSFGDYLGAYRAMSVPINRMQVGRELIERGSAGVRDEQGIPRILPGTFAKANDLDAMAQRATGFDKAKAADILTPDDLSLIASVQDDLQRQAAVGRTLGGGSQTNARKEITGRVGRMASGLMGRFGSIAEGLQRIGADQVQEKIAYLLANPAEARRVLQALQPKQRAAVTRALIEAGSRATAITGSAANSTRANAQPLELDIVGGTPGAAPTVAELNMLRGR